MTVSGPGECPGLARPAGPGAGAAWRTANVGHLMYSATGLCIQDKLEFIHRAGFAAISDAQLALFHHLDPAGARLTTIAARAGLTKQSMVELVNKAAAQGLVVRGPDPGDQRAKLVISSALGRDLLATMAAGVAANERRIAAICGEAFLAEMKCRLGNYVAGHCPEPCTGGPAAPPGAGRILGHASRQFAAQALRIVHQRGHGDVTEVLLALFRNLDLDGTRLTEIAVRARMTKQSMRELVDRAEQLGYIGRAADPADGRAKIITFRPCGLAMLDQMRVGLVVAERELAAATAPGFVGRLKTGLVTYIAALRDGSAVGTALPSDHSPRRNTPTTPQVRLP